MKIMKKIRIHNKDFEVYLTSEQIRNRLKELAFQVQESLQGKDVVFLAVLNGAFVFAADLVRLIAVDCHITFVKVASYRGVNSTGQVQELIGLNENLTGKCVVILEDIIDSGLSMDKVVEMIRHQNPAEIKIVTFLFKPDAFRGSAKPDYTGFNIPNRFVIGYGLDYNGLGRNLGQIYMLSD